MKKLLSIALFALCFSVNAQSSYNVYGTTNGYQNLTPSQVVTPTNNGGYSVYGTTNGFQNLTPSQVVTPTSNGGYNVYGTTNGFQNLIRRRRRRRL